MTRLFESITILVCQGTESIGLFHYIFFTNKLILNIDSSYSLVTRGMFIVTQVTDINIVVLI